MSSTSEWVHRSWEAFKWALFRHSDTPHVVPECETTNSYLIHPLEQVPVMQSIFQYLNVSQLLSCSLVCKTWNTEARRTLQNYRKSVAQIWSSGLSSEELRRFHFHVSRMSFNPFNGLDIHHHCWHNKLETFWKMEEPILPEFPLKYLTIRGACKSIHCPAFRLIMKILYTKLDGLEELVIVDMQHDYSLVRKHYCHLTAKRPQVLLPRLKVLDIGSSSRQWWDVDEVVVAALVAQAPNLKQLRGCVHLSLLNRLPPRQLHTVTSIVVYASEDSREGLNVDLYAQFAHNSHVRLRSLSLYTVQAARVTYLEKFLDSSCALLEGNRASLEVLEIDTLALILILLLRPATRSQCLFPHLSNLQVNLDLQVMNSPVGSMMPLLLDLSRFSPQLKQLSIVVASFSRQHQFFEIILYPLMSWLEDFFAKCNAGCDFEEERRHEENKPEVNLDCVDSPESCLPFFTFESSCSSDGKIQKTTFDLNCPVEEAPAQVYCDFGNREFLFRSAHVAFN